MKPVLATSRTVLGVTAGLVCGFTHFCKWLPIFETRNAPIVSGRIVGRDPIIQFHFFSGVDLTILIDDLSLPVHAIVGSKLASKLPETVQFRFQKNVTRNVFLFEHQENPLWICLICWGGTIILSAYVLYNRKTTRTGTNGNA